MERCVRCATRVKLGQNFCGDCVGPINKFRCVVVVSGQYTLIGMCWSCAAPLDLNEHEKCDYCPTCGTEITPTAPIDLEPRPGVDYGDDVLERLTDRECVRMSALPETAKLDVQPILHGE